MKTKLLHATAAALLVFFGQAGAQSMGGMDHSSMGLADGEVRKVDKDAGKLTIKHGPIPSMDMPPMTMVYRVKDAAMLDQVKAGDKIRFDAEKIGGAYTVTKMVPAAGHD